MEFTLYLEFFVDLFGLHYLLNYIIITNQVGAMFKKSFYHLIGAIIVVAICSSMATLLALYPDRGMFVNEYQFDLFNSWLKRGDFYPYGGAKLAKEYIIVDFEKRDDSGEVPIYFHLEGDKIVVQKEIIPYDCIAYDSETEFDYRFYIEQLILRLNTSHIEFAKDFIKDLSAEISIPGISTEKEVFDEIERLMEGERFQVTKVDFRSISEQKGEYEVTFSNDFTFKVKFPTLTLLKQKYPSLQKRATPVIAPKKIERVVSKPIVDELPIYIEDKEIDIKSIQTITQGMKLPEEELTVREFIEKYKECHWSREILHNKIKDVDAFIRGEFRYHNIDKKRDFYELTTEEFRNISSNLQIRVSRATDGVYFDNTDGYSITQGNIVSLPTDDHIMFEDLSAEETETVAPFLNQLLAMHRVGGTRLINFLLLPADVRTILVLRDPERTVYEFGSYTDLLLMMSHYWENRVVYFNINKVKKINDYIDLEGILIAKSPNDEEFDYAEIKFSLDRDYRISVAMMILYPNTKEED